MKPILLALAALPILAQSAADPEPSAPRPEHLILKVGGLADTGNGRDLHGKLTWRASSALTLYVSGTSSNLASTTQAPSPNGSSTTTTTTSLGGAYAFGLLELGLRCDRTTMSALLASRRYTLLPAFELGAWRIGVEFSQRSTDFDALRFTALPIMTPGGTVYVTGYADLGVSDTGLGASVDYQGEVWRPYASYCHYRYGSIQGSTDVSRIRDGAGMVSPEVFKALAGRMVARLEQLSANRLSGRASLLDATATIGLEADLRRSRWSLEAGRNVDHLTGEPSDTLTATAAWKATRKVTVEFQAGTTRSAVFGTDRFVGLTFTFRTRPGS